MLVRVQSFLCAVTEWTEFSVATGAESPYHFSTWLGTKSHVASFPGRISGAMVVALLMEVVVAVAAAAVMCVFVCARL